MNRDAVEGIRQIDDDALIAWSERRDETPTRGRVDQDLDPGVVRGTTGASAHTDPELVVFEVAEPHRDLYPRVGATAAHDGRGDRAKNDGGTPLHTLKIVPPQPVATRRGLTAGRT